VSIDVSAEDSATISHQLEYFNCVELSNASTSTRYPKMARLTRAVECNMMTIGGTEAHSKGDTPSLILRKLTSLITL